MMKNVRLSRRSHPLPRLANPRIDISGLRGTGYRNDQNPQDPPDGLKAPKKTRPFKTYPMTPAPQGSESPARGEGPTSADRESNG